MISKNTFLDIEDSERPNDVFGRFLLKLVTYLAICGGLVLVVIVLVNFISIAGRTMFGKPLTGDFELVEMGCAVAMFSFMPLCQFKNGNVIVDFFTVNLSNSLNGLGAFLFFLVSSFFTWRMVYGALDMYKYNEETMLLQIPVWIPFIPAVISFGILSITCLYTAIIFFKAALK